MAFAAELLARRSAGLSLHVSRSGGPGGAWGLPPAPLANVPLSSVSGSSGSYDSDDGSGVYAAAAAVPPHLRQPVERVSRTEARQAALGTAAVREALAEKQVRRCGLVHGSGGGQGVLLPMHALAAMTRKAGPL